MKKLIFIVSVVILAVTSVHAEIISNQQSCTLQLPTALEKDGGSEFNGMMEYALAYDVIPADNKNGLIDILNSTLVDKLKDKGFSLKYEETNAAFLDLNQLLPLPYYIGGDGIERLPFMQYASYNGICGGGGSIYYTAKTRIVDLDKPIKIGVAFYNSKKVNIEENNVGEIELGSPTVVELKEISSYRSLLEEFLQSKNLQSRMSGASGASRNQIKSRIMARINTGHFLTNYIKDEEASGKYFSKKEKADLLNLGDANFDYLLIRVYLTKRVIIPMGLQELYNRYVEQVKKCN